MSKNCKLLRAKTFEKVGQNRFTGHEIETIEKLVECIDSYDKVAHSYVKKILDLQDRLNSAINGQETLQGYIMEKNKEIDRLQAKLNEAEDTIQFADAEVKKLYDKLDYCEDKIKELEDQLKIIETEAYKEFAAKLKCGVPQETGVIRCSDVDSLLKELECEDK